MNEKDKEMTEDELAAVSGHLWCSQNKDQKGGTENNKGALSSKSKNKGTVQTIQSVRHEQLHREFTATHYHTSDLILIMSWNSSETSFSFGFSNQMQNKKTN